MSGKRTIQAYDTAQTLEIDPDKLSDGLTFYFNVEDGQTIMRLWKGGEVLADLIMDADDAASISRDVLGGMGALN